MEDRIITQEEIKILKKYDKYSLISTLIFKRKLGIEKLRSLIRTSGFQKKLVTPFTFADNKESGKILNIGYHDPQKIERYGIKLETKSSMAAKGLKRVNLFKDCHTEPGDPHFPGFWHISILNYNLITSAGSIC